MIRGILVGVSALTVAAAWTVPPTAALAQQETMCNPVLDARGEPVVEASGDVVTHSASFPCPPEEEDVAVVEEEPETREVEPAAGPPAPEQETVYFDFDVAQLDDESQARVAELLEEIRSGQTDVAGATVAGHADRAGPSEYNMELSERRAENVAAELIRGGVPARVVQTTGFGEEQPAVETEDGVALPANRRAIIDLSY